MTEPSSSYEQVRGRAGRRKSPWNLLLLAGIALGWAGVYLGLFWLLDRLQQWQLADGAFLFQQSHAGELILHLPLAVAALPLGMLVANAIFWCIPPARQSFEREAEGCEGASFRPTMWLLLGVSAVGLVLCLPISWLGTFTGVSYAMGDGVRTGWDSYDWSEIVAVDLWCCGQGDGDLGPGWMGYRLRMADGVEIDLLRDLGELSMRQDLLERWGPPPLSVAELGEQSRARRIEGLQRIQPFLAANGRIATRWQFTETAHRRLKKRYGDESWVPALAALLEETEVRAAAHQPVHTSRPGLDSAGAVSPSPAE